MDLSKVEYHTRPVTLQQHVWMEQAAQGSFTAILALILCRTNIPQDEALQIEDEDLGVIIVEIGQAMARSVVLAVIGRSIENAQ